MVAFGANLPFSGFLPAETLRAAAGALVREGLRPVRTSALYQTEAFPPGSGPPFVNGVVAFETGLTPPETLALLAAVEGRFGRERVRRWGARTLDLDLLAFGDAVLPDRATETRWRTSQAAAEGAGPPPELILPHPRIAERGFVLVPLGEAAPDWHHPVTGLTAADMIARLPAEALSQVVRLSASFGLSSAGAGPK